MAHTTGADAFPGRWAFDTAHATIGTIPFTVLRAGLTGGTGSWTEGYFLFRRDARTDFDHPSLALLHHYHEAPFEDPNAAFAVQGCLLFRPPDTLAFLLAPDSTPAAAAFITDTTRSDNSPKVPLSRQPGLYSLAGNSLSLARVAPAPPYLGRFCNAWTQ
jgi:hypothetical protein